MPFRVCLSIQAKLPDSIITCLLEGTDRNIQNINKRGQNVAFQILTLRKTLFFLLIFIIVFALQMAQENGENVDGSILILWMINQQGYL